MNILLGIMYILSCGAVLGWMFEVRDSEISGKYWLVAFLGIQIVEFILRALLEFAK